MPNTTLRSFRFTGGGSDKFWTIALDGAAHTVRFGRSGTAGQTKTKAFDSAAEAEASCAKLIAQKLKKGYVEEGDPPAQDQAEPASSKATKAKAKATKAKAKTTKEKTTKEKTTKAKTTKAKAKTTKAKAKTTKAKAKTTGRKRAGPTLDVASVDFEPRVELSPTAPFFALWRDPEPLARPASAAFDHEAFLARLAELETGLFSKAFTETVQEALDGPLDPEGGGWWYAALKGLNYERGPAQVAAQVEADPPGAVTLDQVAADLRVDPQSGLLAWPGAVWAGAWLQLWSRVLDEAGLNDLLLERFLQVSQWRGGYRDGNYVLHDYRRCVLPYLSRAERARFGAQVVRGLEGDLLARLDEPGVRARLYLAATLGQAAPIRALFDRLQPGDDERHGLVLGQLVFGLGDAERMIAEAARLGIRLMRPEELEGWLAATGGPGLGLVVDSILESGGYDPQEQVGVVLQARVPDAVGHVLGLRTKRQTARYVKRWLDANPGVAARGLIRLLGDDALAEDAEEFLATLAEDAPAVVRRALELEAPSAEVSATVTGLLEGGQRPPAPLPAALAAACEAVAGLRALPPKQRAEWLNPGRLAAPTVSGAALNGEQVGLVLRALRETPLQPADGDAAAPGPALLAALKSAAAPESLEGLAWSAYRAWERNGFPPAQKWILGGLGLLGGDATVARLTPLIRAWPGESQHARAVLGLDCLRAIGSEAALTALAGIAQKLKFRALKQRAIECMDEIAAARGLSREELADRLVPTCGLDPQGQRSFDYGARRFAFCLGPELKPMVRADDGKLLKAPPKPGKRDDAELAPQALADWRAFKKELTGVLKIQRERLEQAMVAGRRWHPDEFRALIVEHPLLGSVARGVVWATYGPEGPAPFRLDDAGGARDLAGKPRVLDDPIGALHPLQLEDAERAAWQALWDREGRLCPFPQLEREVVLLDPRELSGRRLRFACGSPIPPHALRGTLAGQGWQRGEAQDAGLVGEHYKHFEGAGLTAVLQHGGLSVVPFEWEDDQPVEGVLFLEGALSPGECAWLEADAGIALGEIDRTVLSEVARDLTLIDRKRRG